MVPLSMYSLGFGMGTMLANFHMCGIMLVLRAVLNILLRNASPRGPMCFRCLIFNLSGPCEFLFLRLVKQFAICLVDVLCWIDRIWSSKECACCVCDPSVHLS